MPDVCRLRAYVLQNNDFLHKIDGVASTEQRTRSELIREALRTYMRRTGIKNPEKAENEAKTLEELIG